MGKKLKSGSGCSESLETIFWVKHPGSATLLFNFVIFDDDRFKNYSPAPAMVI
jgi:hypothetical protein